MFLEVPSFRDTEYYRALSWPWALLNEFVTDTVARWLYGVPWRSTYHKRQMVAWRCDATRPSTSISVTQGICILPWTFVNPPPETELSRSFLCQLNGDFMDSQNKGLTKHGKYNFEKMVWLCTRHSSTRMMIDPFYKQGCLCIFSQSNIPFNTSRKCSVWTQLGSLRRHDCVHCGHCSPSNRHMSRDTLGHA